jgi:hypothetical protein
VIIIKSLYLKPQLSQSQLVTELTAYFLLSATSNIIFVPPAMSVMRILNPESGITQKKITDYNAFNLLDNSALLDILFYSLNPSWKKFDLSS